MLAVNGRLTADRRACATDMTTRRYGSDQGKHEAEGSCATGNGHRAGPTR